MENLDKNNIEANTKKTKHQHWWELINNLTEKCTVCDTKRIKTYKEAPLEKLYTIHYENYNDKKDKPAVLA
jgi:2-hydroxy-3-keto-5-methylthiopentenyl-1-phosphate phosphatase